MNKKSQLKIGIDARFFGPKQKGLGRYVQKLVENLEKIMINRGQSPAKRGLPPVSLEFVIFLRKDNWNEYQPANPNFKKVLANYKWYGFKEQIFFPFKIRKHKIDLMHFPHFNIPIFYFRPFIITIHDLILKKFSTCRASTLTPFIYWLKSLAYQVVIFLAVKRSKKIIAVSNYTKNDILEYFKVKSSKIKVIYEGAPDSGTASQIEGSPPAILRRGLPPTYLLYVGNAYPHKNLERLILAFNKLIKDKKNLHLILVGEIDYFYKRIQDKFSGSKQIIFTDFVSDKKLTYLYKNASLYIFPSLYEGFGLPPLEAMSYGTPVVCSQSSCLPEVLEDSVIYFNPEDINDMAEKIKYVLNNKDIQERLILMGFKQIRKYKWEKMALEILKIYKSVD